MQEDFIQNLREGFEQGFVDDDVVVCGNKYYMRTLNGLETLWVDRYTELSMNASFLSSRKIPTLAIAIKTINDISIADIFSKELPPVDDKIAKTINRREDDFSKPEFLAADEFKKFLDKDVPAEAVTALWNKYLELEKKAAITLTQLIESDKKEDKKEIPTETMEPTIEPVEDSFASRVGGPDAESRPTEET